MKKSRNSRVGRLFPSLLLAGLILSAPQANAQTAEDFEGLQKLEQLKDRAESVRKSGQQVFDNRYKAPPPQQEFNYEEICWGIGLLLLVLAIKKFA
jgi:hypothetical protein